MTDSQLLYKYETLGVCEFKDFLDDSLSTGIITLNQYLDYMEELSNGKY